MMTAAAKKAFVARMKKARKNPTNKTAKRKAPKAAKRKSNPTRRKSTHRRRSNPNFSILTNPKGIAVNIVTALLSAVATRQLPQMLLKDKNKGWMGYGANVAAGIAATFAASEFISAAAAQAALLGSGVIVLDRVLTEKFSPVGQYLSLTGLGDATAATSLGQVADGYYIHPTIFNADGSPLIPHEITDAAVREFNSMQPQPRAMIAPSPGAMSGVGRSSRFASRF